MQRRMRSIALNNSSPAWRPVKSPRRRRQSRQPQLRLQTATIVGCETIAREARARLSAGQGHGERLDAAFPRPHAAAVVERDLLRGAVIVTFGRYLGVDVN